MGTGTAPAASSRREPIGMSWRTALRAEHSLGPVDKRARYPQSHGHSSRDLGRRRVSGMAFEIGPRVAPRGDLHGVALSSTSAQACSSPRWPRRRSTLGRLPYRCQSAGRAGVRASSRTRQNWPPGQGSALVKTRSHGRPILEGINNNAHPTTQDFTLM